MTAEGEGHYLRTQRSHYDWLEENFNIITSRLDLRPHGLNFSSNGDKFYSYRDQAEAAGITWFHLAAMYILMDDYFYREVRKTKDGWVAPIDWIIANYHGGHNFARVMEDLE